MRDSDFLPEKKYIVTATDEEGAPTEVDRRIREGERETLRKIEQQGPADRGMKETGKELGELSSEDKGRIIETRERLKAYGGETTESKKSGGSEKPNQKTEDSGKQEKKWNLEQELEKMKLSENEKKYFDKYIEGCEKLMPTMGEMAWREWDNQVMFGEFDAQRGRPLSDNPEFNMQYFEFKKNIAGASNEIVNKMSFGQRLRWASMEAVSAITGKKAKVTYGDRIERMHDLAIKLAALKI